MASMRGRTGDDGSGASRAPRARAGVPAGIAVGCGALTWWLGGRTAAEGQETWRALAGAAPAGTAPGVDELVTLTLLTLGTAVALWYALTALLVVAARTRQDAGVTVVLVLRWGSPVLRRAVLSTTAAGLGVSMVVGVGPTSTGALASEAGDHLPEDLGWGTSWPAQPERRAPAARPEGLDLPGPTERPAGGPGETPATRPAEHRTAAGQDGEAPVRSARGHEVLPGDTLWEIAAAHLGGRASAGQVAAAWPRWHATNIQVIGPDPDLIHPGQVLFPPSEEAS